MSKAADAIRKLAKEAAKENIKEQQKSVEERVSQDIEVIERILKLVKQRLIYKEVKKSSHSHRKEYVVVTEDIALADYATQENKYASGTSITWDDGGYWSYPHTNVRLNGHIYHHAGDLITKYKYEANQAMKKSDQENKLAKERKLAIENLEDLEPTIKSLMLNYQEQLGIDKNADV